jgi:hypothetical protein
LGLLRNGVVKQIPLEDVLLLGGYPILGDPVFISLEDQEMKVMNLNMKHSLLLGYHFLFFLIKVMW